MTLNCMKRRSILKLELQYCCTHLHTIMSIESACATRRDGSNALVDLPKFEGTCENSANMMVAEYCSQK